jgi:prolyl oligopeptidase PreP (S9A serine peptidase family)
MITLVLMMIGTVTICFAGCDSPGSKYPVSIDDIEWTTGSQIVDGERSLQLNYTNKSDVTIKDVSMEFVVKENLSKEEKKSMYSYMKSRWGIKKSELDTLSANGKINMSVDVDKVTDPDESSGADVYYFDTEYKVNSKEQFDLMQPDKMTITYVDDDNKFKTVAYDYNSKEYSEDEDSLYAGETAFEWSDSKISKMIPKPDSKVVEIYSDDKELFSFDAYGISQDEYDAYIKACKAKGFTKGIESDGQDFKASDSKEYKISVSYDKSGNDMDLEISKD